MVTHRQITQLVKEFNKEGNKSMSALKSGMTRRTAAKYLNLKDPYHPPRVEHNWATRKDAFSGKQPEKLVKQH